ncbi:GNAT family N-acetyltransferase [Lichenicoccus roseus]|uniref:GNAT family N-acetyltransferase n=1 Tax=Lichenicoccus roseus TaxID=2683649 RepID=A0A5R9JAB3_9PROT|nr:GNAT family N-acetyltransferase [Lichenicoccus roseus]TLU72306.1 GNAT family N-acetyltransferase [Lichenicoccus roseus]
MLRLGSPTRTAHEVVLASGHAISDDRGRIDMEMVLASLAQTYWAVDMPPSLLLRSWTNCLPFGIYAPDERQVGFGRLLTDYALRAHLGDVFVHPGSRGLGLGRALVETILSHPGLATVGHWTLRTADAHSLYARYGFRQDPTDSSWMTLDRSR